MEEYSRFFERITAHSAFPYQTRLGTEPWPDLLDIPTGLGKTAAVVVAWLWRLRNDHPEKTRRLVYCLPMRTLVRQTAAAAQEWCDRAAPLLRESRAAVPRVHVLLGGEVAAEWEAEPEQPAVLVGTQDMLLSRALNRGYAMSRYAWPLHFGLLHNDCQWVFDETQLMGVGVETGAQLDGLRSRLGTALPSRSIWMSATLATGQMATIDHPEPEQGWSVRALGPNDRDQEMVARRLNAPKSLAREGDVVLSATTRDGHAGRLAAIVGRAHDERGGLTLVFINRVDRAQDVYRALLGLPGRTPANTGLVHARFRAHDRAEQERQLGTGSDRVVVTTQALEAGVDISARTLFTELAPWPSLVQRMGRCNRYGETDDARVVWIDIECPEGADAPALPYARADLDVARGLVAGLTDASPASLRKVAYEPPHVVRAVLRRRDLLDLFDTTPDLLGNDLDVSRFIREADDTDVHFLWRAFDGDRPSVELARPERDELCRVSVGAAREFLAGLEKKRKSSKHGSVSIPLRAWQWDPLEESWQSVTAPRPGQILLLHQFVGGYDTAVGWTGVLGTEVAVAEMPAETAAVNDEAFDGDGETTIGRWIELGEHLSHAFDETSALAAALELPAEWCEALRTAAAWHDVGKAHPEFQRKLVEPVRDDAVLAAPGDGPWAKSPHRRRAPGTRRYLRHELASALAWLADGIAAEISFQSLVAYLIAAHHGKVRLSIRSVPGEQEPPDGRLFARGVWEGDVLPQVTLPNGERAGPVELDLSAMRLGKGSWLERTLALRDDPNLGPFRLTYLEALLRVADRRASAKEARHDDPE